jgi:zinc D-Ala-D-Ala carboxypeptidase
MKWYWWAIGTLIVIVIISQINRVRVMGNFKNIKLGPNFDLSEFVKTNTGLENVPGETEIENLKLLVKNILQPLRDHLQKPISITSGYRSPLVNGNVEGSSKTSQHMKGQAADIVIAGMTNQQIIDAVRALSLPYDQIIDEQRGKSLWVHVSYTSTGGRKQWLTRRDPGPDRPREYETIKIG